MVGVIVAASIPALAWYEDYRSKRGKDEEQRREANRQREIENLASQTGFSLEQADRVLHGGEGGPKTPPSIDSRVAGILREDAERRRSSPREARPDWLEPPKPPPRPEAERRRSSPREARPDLLEPPEPPLGL